MFDLLVFEHVLERARKLDELHAAEADREPNAAKEDQDDQKGNRESGDLERSPPNLVVNQVHVVRERIQPCGCLHRFFLAFPSFCLRDRPRPFSRSYTFGTPHRRGGSPDTAFAVLMAV